MSSSTVGWTFSTFASGEDLLRNLKLLMDHPLAAELGQCDSVESIKAILQGEVREYRQFRDGDQRLMKWVDTNVLFSLGIVSLRSSP